MEKKESRVMFDPYPGRTRSLTGGIFAGFIVIWVGVSLYLAVSQTVPWSKWWSLFLAGLGGLFLLNSIVWIFLPATRDAFLGMLIPGLILSSIGLIFYSNAPTWWPFVIVVIGVVIIVSVIWQHAWQRAKSQKT